MFYLELTRPFLQFETAISIRLVCGCGEAAACGFRQHKPDDQGGTVSGRGAKVVACATAADSPPAAGDTVGPGTSFAAARPFSGHAGRRWHCNIPDQFSGGCFLPFPDGSFCKRKFGPYSALNWDKTATIIGPKLPDRGKNGKKKGKETKKRGIREAMRRNL